MALQGRDPVLTIQVEDPGLGRLPGSFGGAMGPRVLLGGVGALGGDLELGQGLADLALLMAQPLGLGRGDVDGVAALGVPAATTGPATARPVRGSRC